MTVHFRINCTNVLGLACKGAAGLPLSGRTAYITP